MKYNREKAINYALKWALNRNPKYYNYDFIGGDCTNFVSQCLFAGKPQMNYVGYGWYYINANNKSPSWTGVKYLYEFLINNKYEGPQGIEVPESDVEIGDVIQLSFSNDIFGHSLFITSVEGGNIKICAHTVDSKNRLLDTYYYEKIRFIKIS